MKHEARFDLKEERTLRLGEMTGLLEGNAPFLDGEGFIDIKYQRNNI